MEKAHPDRPTHAPVRQGLLSAFFQGAKSGAFNSALMMGIIFAISSIPFFGIPTMLPSLMAVSVAGSTLFTGILGAKKAYDAAHSAPSQDTPNRTHAAGRSPTRAREPEMDMELPARRTDWAERTGRSNAPRVREILEAGARTEQSYGDAVLESREQASASRHF